MNEERTCLTCSRFSENGFCRLLTALEVEECLRKDGWRAGPASTMNSTRWIWRNWIRSDDPGLRRGREIFKSPPG